MTIKGVEYETELFYENIFAFDIMYFLSAGLGTDGQGWTIWARCDGFYYP